MGWVVTLCDKHHKERIDALKKKKAQMMTAKIREAYLFAMKKHGDTLDDEGKPYFETHVVKVSTAISVLTEDEDVICATILHDTLEDTKTTYDEIKEKFGLRVADLVNELTHEGKPDDYGYYFPRLKSAEAILIKLIDRASNISRMNAWDKSRQQAYLNKTKFWKSGNEILS